MTSDHVRCRECGLAPIRVGPFLLCVNLACRALVVGVFR